jgi:hypothetical protein
MVTLWQLGRADLIPKETAAAMAASMRGFFPPSSIRTDPNNFRLENTRCITFRAIARWPQCIKALTARGIDVDREILWIRSWVLKYQSPDGGLNCDEKHYSIDKPCSSIVSIVPCLEAMLRSAQL